MASKRDFLTAVLSEADGIILVRVEGGRPVEEGTTIRKDDVAGCRGEADVDVEGGGRVTAAAGRGTRGVAGGCGEGALFWVFFLFFRSSESGAGAEKSDDAPPEDEGETFLEALLSKGCCALRLILPASPSSDFASTTFFTCCKGGMESLSG